MKKIFKIIEIFKQNWKQAINKNMFYLLNEWIYPKSRDENPGSIILR